MRTKMPSSGQRIHDYIGEVGLKVRCDKCGARGRFRGWQQGLRLAHVRHDCGGRMRTTRELHRGVDQETRNRALYDWPTDELGWDVVGWPVRSGRSARSPRRE